jgi:hypothetical protein
LGAQLLSHRNEIDAAGGDLAKIEAACKRFDELEGYLLSNIGSPTDLEGLGAKAKGSYPPTLNRR